MSAEPKHTIEWWHEWDMVVGTITCHAAERTVREQRKVIEAAMKDHVRFHSYVGNEDGVLIPVPCTICDAALAALSPPADERTEP